MRALRWFSQPKTQLHFWAAWTAVWVVLLPVTLATFLKVSLEWVVFMSLFANAASCGTATVAALAYVRAESADRKADHVIEYHPDVPSFVQESA